MEGTGVIGQVQHLDLMRQQGHRPSHGLRRHAARRRAVPGAAPPRLDTKCAGSGGWSWPIRKAISLPGCSRWNSRSVSTVKLGPHAVQLALVHSEAGLVGGQRVSPWRRGARARPSGGRFARAASGQPQQALGLQLLQRQAAQRPAGGRGGRVEAAAEQSKFTGSVSKPERRRRLVGPITRRRKSL